MLLSDLQIGERGVIVKVTGHSAFRKRIVEMGFIKGKIVESLLNAPLKDPIKYKIMDFEVSLRRSEARHIEIVSIEEAKKLIRDENEDLSSLYCNDKELTQKFTKEKEKVINVALVGNPNCGKTCIFNIASHSHERVGNYSGVTVDSKEGRFKFQGYTFNLVDLPGTYSLSAYSPEELFVRKHIITKTPDVILNVVDSSNLERNLYLTTQVIDMDVKIIMALNMYDELTSSNNKLDYNQLGKLLGMPIVPTIGRTGEGVKELFQKIIDVYEDKDKTVRHIHINHGKELEENINLLRKKIIESKGFEGELSTRFVAIKLLENDKELEKITLNKPNGQEIINLRNEIKTKYKIDNKEDSEEAITDAKYAFIHRFLQETFQENKQEKRKTTKIIDKIVTNKFLSFPIFFLFMYITFFCTFSIGGFPMDWIDSFMGWLGDFVGNNMADGALKDLIVNGIIAGVGSVIVFLPNILILYLFISFMEDSGYMARAAFIMDKIMHKMGLHGKSFIPMIMGFGCNIPAIMSTRTIEDRKSRLITMLIIPLMSCSARLPIYMILIGAFFPKHSAIILLGLYVTGIVMSILMAKIFSKFVVKGESSPFVMELPPYRMPTGKSLLRHTWEKGKQYLKKMGTIILGAAIVVWFLSYYPNHNQYTNVEQQTENSYMGKIGKTIEPVLSPCGFDWKQSVAIITGAAAKEIVASTMGILYSSNGKEAEEISQGDIHEKNTSSHLSKLLHKSITPLSAISMMLFVLLYMPCIPGVVSIKGESGKWRWALFVVVYTIALAWIVSFSVYQIGSLLM